MDWRGWAKAIYIWISVPRMMPKWKADAKEFTVVVNYHETRGFQLNVPRPVMDHLSRPERVTFVIRRQKVEVRAA
jgi:hypothetical protein